MERGNLPRTAPAAAAGPAPAGARRAATSLRRRAPGPAVSPVPENRGREADRRALRPVGLRADSAPSPRAQRRRDPARRSLYASERNELTARPGAERQEPLAVPLAEHPHRTPSAYRQQS